MSGFTDPALTKKLNELDDSLYSIQSTSLWLIHHRTHHNTVVKVWLREFLKAKVDRRLSFLYLANDVIQNSRKGGSEYQKTFKKTFVKAFQHLHECDENTKCAVERVLSVWQERAVYAPVQIMTYKRAMVLGTDPEAYIKKMRREEESREKSNEEPFDLSSQIVAQDLPGLEGLMQAIRDLDANNASADEGMIGMIAGLPRELYDSSLGLNISSKHEAEDLCKQAAEAMSLLHDYNSRLSKEIDRRKKLSVMTRDYLTFQEQMLSHTENLFETLTDKFQKVSQIRKKLKDYMRNMPDDLGQLPNVTLGWEPPAQNWLLQ